MSYELTIEPLGQTIAVEDGQSILDAALREEKPCGLAALGDWPTIYEGLSELPEPARTSNESACP